MTDRAHVTRREGGGGDEVNRALTRTLSEVDLRADLDQSGAPAISTVAAARASSRQMRLTEALVRPNLRTLPTRRSTWLTRAAYNELGAIRLTVTLAAPEDLTHAPVELVDPCGAQRARSDQIDRDVGRTAGQRPAQGRLHQLPGLRRSSTAGPSRDDLPRCGGPRHDSGIRTGEVGRT